MKDRYGNEHSTASIQAYDDYCDGLDRFLAAQPGGIERLQRATLSDPGYAVAHADLARALQISGDGQAARTAMRSAREHLDGLDWWKEDRIRRSTRFVRISRTTRAMS
jgi:hypothetical protein